MSDDKPDLPNDAIPKNKVEAFLLAQKYLNRLPLSVQLGLAGIGLIVAFYFGAQLRKTLFDNQENLARTLAATIVSTAYPHRGVTAFLVADLDNKLASETHYNNPNLKVAVDEIKNEIEQLKTSAINKGFEANTVFNDLKLVVVNKPKLEQRDIDHTWTKAIISQTMKSKDAYLMIPAISLRQPKVGDNKLEGNELQQIVQNNPEVLFDFYVASKIDEKLSKLGNLPGQTPRIVQAYFISESGVILLRALPKSRSYDEAFPTNTLFMDRLYFWGAIDPDVFGPEKDNNGPLDYQTAPYIDLGGNGVVKTYSTRVELPNFRTGVICVDVALSNARGEIRERLEALGAQVNDASHVSGKKQLEGEPGTTYPKGFDWVNYQLNGQAQSRITGAIAFESDFQRPAEDAIVRFSIPIESVTSVKDTTVTKLLLVTFDFASIRNRIFGYAIGFVSGILLLVFVMWNLFWHYTRLKHDMNKVLENLSQVMHEAETPFAWLNEKNEFQKVNVSFLDVLGCKTDHELKTYAPTFKDLVTADTLPTYEAILAQSAQGEPTPKYRINLVKRNREVISVWVHGERIPYPTFGKRRSPHRFGVFLPSRAPATENAPHDVITDDGSKAMLTEPG